MNNKIKKTYKIDGLTCANCSIKLESKLNNIDGIDAKINFTAQKVTMNVSKKISQNKSVEILRKLADEVEPNVSIKDYDDNTNQSSNKKIILIEVINIFLSIILVIIGMNIPIKHGLILFILAYIISGNKTIIKAYKNLGRRDFFDENFLMVVATVGAFLIGEFTEAVAVMVFYKIGQMLESLAVNKSRKSIKSLINIKPTYANIIYNGELKKVSPEVIEIGDNIIIKPGEKVPIDGIIIKGRSEIDLSTIKGESIPVEVNNGDELLSGSINLTGLLTIKAMKKFRDSTVSKILELVENSELNKAKVESFITKFARIYTPTVVLLTVLVAIIPPIITGEYDFVNWIHKSLIFLVISCPCALVISVPLAYFAGVGIASQNGILIKGGNYLEALSNIENILFDKTGTLTYGKLKVDNIVNNKGITKGELIKYALYAEYFSNHPIANAIKEECENIKIEKTTDYKEISGMGVEVRIGSEYIIAGNDKLMEKNKINYESKNNDYINIHIAVNKKYFGNITFLDKLKEDSIMTIKDLKKLRIRKTAILTGDKKDIAKKIANKLNIDEFYHDLLPHNKLEILKRIKANSKNGKTVFVGDGINDTPALTLADVGISMGGIGSEAAIESSDVVLMTDEPSKIINTIKIAKFTKHIAIQNILFALLIKIIIMIMGIYGLADLWEAVFADVGVTLIVVFNSLRIVSKNYN
ncbi:MAG: heavy metal translocating P-type ATPase [Clostridiales bacterium]